MYFETGQGSALSANAHHGVDQQTLEARAYAVARRFEPLLVNTVVGFIGPEYLYDGKQIIRAGLEDHFCGKLLGVPMGVDVCYTNHAEADQDDMDIAADAARGRGRQLRHGRAGRRRRHAELPAHLVPRRALCPRPLRTEAPAPEFEAWLVHAGLADAGFRLAGHAGLLPDFAARLIDQNGSKIRTGATNDAS